MENHLLICCFITNTVDCRYGCDNNYIFTASPSGSWITNKAYNSGTGLLSFTIDLSGQSQIFANDRPKFCRPQTYCSIQNDGSCGCAPGTSVDRTRPGRGLTLMVKLSGLIDSG